MKAAKRRRCVLLMDGSAIGCFQRNTHETHTVVLEPSGHTYSYIQPDGTHTRHLTPTALSSHRYFVLDTLNFRNRFSHHAPYVCQHLMESSTVRRQHRIRSPRATWPCFEGKTKASRLYNAENKCFELQSIDGAAKVRLHLSGKFVDIYCVVEVMIFDEDVDESSSHADYTTLLRSFAVNETPQEFKFPVELVCTARTAWSKDQNAYLKCDGNGIAVSQLPRNGAFTARPTFAVITTRNDTAHVDGSQNGYLSLAEVLRVATIPSKFLYRRAVAELGENDATLFISRRAADQLPEIVVLHRNGSLLTACEGFFTLFDELGQLQHRFTRETIPPSTTIGLQVISDSIPSLCHHIDYVLQAFKYAAPLYNKSALTSSALQPDELEMVEEAEIKDGRFRAFRGGQIRVAFADRTILRVAADGENCSFFFPDGTSGQTTFASAPVRHRSYIHKALEFGDWAFASQEERMQRHETRQQAQAMVTRELLRNHVRCGMNSELELFWLNHSKERKGDQALEGSDSLVTLSQDAVQELQAATRAHIASVNIALQTACMAARNDTKSDQIGYNDTKID